MGEMPCTELARVASLTTGALGVGLLALLLGIHFLLFCILSRVLYVVSRTMKPSPYGKTEGGCSQFDFAWLGEPSPSDIGAPDASTLTLDADNIGTRRAVHRHISAVYRIDTCPSCQHALQS